ncbi:MAG TPA: gluconate 2-dehydrogenase subunit 3 family protein [Rhizomicrobium sp.]
MPLDRLTRRSILASGTAISSGFLVLRGAQAQTFTAYPTIATSQADRPASADPLQGYLFFTPTEALFVETAVSRLIPKDELGPGALECGVAVFIDRQLAGPYGQGDHFYLKGPSPSGEATQGWQMPKPADVYRSAIMEVNRYANDAHEGDFARLAAERQDEILKSLESGGAKLKGGIDSKAFFTLLLQNTMEGFFADPLYGGNRDMAGWKLIGFPGARYNNKPFVTQHGQAYPLPPVSLNGRPDWTRS